MSDSKPQMQKGELCGGIAIEQTYRSQFHVRNANRAYHTTVSYQDAYSLEAPYVSNKVNGVREKDAANMLRQCLNELTVCNANAGLAKGAPNLLPLMKEWAEVANYPKPGGFNRYKDFGTKSDNPCWTASQTNCASAVSSDDSDEASLEGPLGKYGGTHGDCNNCTIPPTAATVFTHPHPNVPKECFCLLKFEVVWVMEEFLTLFFSGLHMHGGGLAQYNPICTDKALYIHITAILYPPQAVLSGHSALAFAAMLYPPDPCRAYCDDNSNPGKEGEEVYATSGSSKPSDPLKTSLLKLPKEWCHQGYLQDESILNKQPTSAMEEVSLIKRTTLTMGFTALFNGSLVSSNNSHLSTFSMEKDGVRVGANLWPLGLGWSGDYVRIGVQSDVDINTLTPEEIAK
ncbi:hypothetical protein F5146DRAFT_1146541 [Armillaria mellea]|nr:hypothetical protein F5146DRAFT_1146541 [Armillaria mellea]